MITPTQMYWLITLDSICATALILTVVIGFMFIFSLFFVADRCVPVWVPFVSGTLAFVFAVIVTFTPSTKQMAAILIVPRIANSEKVQIVGNRLYDLAVEWMDELKPRKGEAK